MRTTIALALLILLTGPLAAQSGATDLAAAQEKSIMNRGAQSVTPVRGSTESVTAAIELGNPTWDRIFTDDVDNNCLATSVPSGVGIDVPYAAVHIEVTQAEAFVASISGAATTVQDTVMAIYCEGFNAEIPGDNLIAFDDDGGGALHPAFDVNDGIVLQPGTTYWVVVSTFQPGDFGSFQLDFFGPTVQVLEVVVPVELQGFSVD